MIEVLIQILVLLLVLFIAWYIIRLVASQFAVPAVWVNVVGLILFLIALLYVLRMLGVRAL